MSTVRFASIRGAIRRNVLFVFQPAEETTGGAKTVCESGVFERYGADRILASMCGPICPPHVGELLRSVAGAFE